MSWWVVSLALIVGVGLGFALRGTLFRDTDVRPATSPTLRAVVVPDVRGLTHDKAQAKLRAVGLDIGMTIAGRTCRACPGTVVSQEPNPGTFVMPGSLVDITIPQHPPDPGTGG
jgi:hypothetical protein